MPKISVIIPIYNNKEEYLKKCLTSVLNQTFSDFELILVDDGAKDESLKICQSFAEQDPRVKVFTKKNGGISSARNYGIEKSVSEYICFIDHDDWVEAEYLETFISNVGNSDLLITNYNLVQRDKIEKNKKFVFFELEKDIFEPSDFNQNYEFKLTNVPWNKIYKRSIIIENNIRFLENIRIGGEDLIFVMEYALKISKIKLINAYTYNYNRMPGHSVTVNYIKNYYQEAIKIKDALNEIEIRYQEISEESRLYNCFRVASKAIFEENKPASGKSFSKRYFETRQILKIPEVKQYIKTYKLIKNTDSKFFSLIQKLMYYRMPFAITLFFTIFYNIRTCQRFP